MGHSGLTRGWAEKRWQTGLRWLRRHAKNIEFVEVGPNRSAPDQVELIKPAAVISSGTPAITIQMEWNGNDLTARAKLFEYAPCFAHSGGFEVCS